MALKSRIILGAAVLLVAAGLACSTTPAPTPAPTPTKSPPPVVESYLVDTTFEYITELSEGLGPRASTTDEEKAAAEYLESQFTALGYSVATQAFTVETFQSGFMVDQPGPESVESISLVGSGVGEASGVLVPIGLGREEDLPEEGLEGKIVLAERGLITFEQKVSRARDAGAIGVIIYNNLPRGFRGNLRRDSKVPAISISQADGRRMVELISAGEVKVTISVAVEANPSRNVVAEKPGSGERIVILGGHYDTVPNVAGANDNASGTAVLLTMAQELSQKSFPFTLRFIAFGSEELGLRGSQFYVNSLTDEEQGQIIAMLNFDALGSGNKLGTLGNRELTDMVVQHGRERGIDVEVSPGITGGSSDHASFANAGVPVVMFFSDDSSRLHTPEDTLEFINPKLPGDAARLALDLLNSIHQNLLPLVVSGYPIPLNLVTTSSRSPASIGRDWNRGHQANIPTVQLTGHKPPLL